MVTSHRNVLLLALCQAAFVSTQTLTATVGSLAGHALAENKALATLPSAAMVIGTALSTIPASLLMKRVGRRLGFVTGSTCAVGGGLICAVALAMGIFWLLVAGSGLLGLSGGFAQQYRFAAAETAAAAWRSRAISLVLAGGLAAGFVGPQLATWTRTLFDVTYLGAYLCVPGLGVLTIALLLGLRMPRSSEATVRIDGHARPIGVIVRQPIFLVGVLNFWVALTLNGVGWNFMFVAGSALVTKAYAPGERARTQAANDFLVFGTAALTSLSSGQLMHRRGWHVVLATAMLMLLAALIGALWRTPRTTAAPRRHDRASAR